MAYFNSQKVVILSERSESKDLRLFLLLHYST
jgi:hypothetical protein